ncbi:MAG: hypothetical protein U9P12_04655, partial [Verrucomicrobiota bacterium]|nr:hypothetical protein [Verrucomicrobiota bacterium]
NLPQAISSTTCLLNASLYLIAVLSFTLDILLSKVTTYVSTGQLHIAYNPLLAIKRSKNEDLGMPQRPAVRPQV